MAATRLRRTFHYPSDTDDDDTVEQGMDAQDQATLLSDLSTHDTSSTRLYTTLLLIFPLVPAALYLPRLLILSTVLPSIVAIASLLATAYTMFFIPLPPVKVGVDAPTLKTQTRKKKYSGGYGYNVTSSSEQQGRRAERKTVPYVSDESADLIAKYIVPANAAVCVLLAIVEVCFGARTWSEGVMIGGGYLPGLVLSVVLWARRELRVVDMTDLEKLKDSGKAT